jgi:hypothetical protein
MNDLTIHQALATRIAAATPPTGYTLRAVHTTPPDNVAVVPAVVLVPGSDTISYGASNRTTVLTINAVLYVNEQADMQRKYADLLTWRAWLRDVVLGDTTLGNGLVAQASCTATDIGTDTYADTQYLTVSATIECSILEVINVSP